MTNRWVLEGKCLYGEYRGDVLGVPVEGLYLWSYDESKQRYIEAYADSSTTWMRQFEGVCSDDGKVIMMGTEIEDPSTGEPVELRMTITLLSEEEFKCEFFTRRQGVADVFKSQEILLTRMP